jgi:hypothetical protein
MPIRINLLADALAEEDLRRRDPVKRAIYGGVFLVALSLVWFSSIWLTFVLEKEKLNSVEAQIQAHSNDYTLVKNNLKKIDDVQKRMDALDQLSSARFLQGNLLNALQQTYVPNVQLTRVRLEQSYSAAAGIAPKTNSFGVIAGRPPSVTQHILLTVDARDTSPNPGGDQVNRFKNALLRQDYFNHNLDTTNGIRLSSMSALQSPPDGKPYVTFTLECRFLDKTP